jgi:hypothetical protein
MPVAWQLNRLISKPAAKVRLDAFAVATIF